MSRCHCLLCEDPRGRTFRRRRQEPMVERDDSTAHFDFVLVQECDESWRWDDLLPEYSDSRTLRVPFLDAVRIR